MLRRKVIWMETILDEIFKAYDITTKTSVFYAQSGIKNIEKICL